MIDVLVNNAGIERTGSIEGLAIDDFKADDGDELLRPTPHDSSLAAGYEATPERMHHQRHVCRRADRLFAAHTVFGNEIRA